MLFISIYFVVSFCFVLFCFVLFFTTVTGMLFRNEPANLNEGIFIFESI